jgi:endonuclease YncB( thermonuclease family)
MPVFTVVAFAQEANTQLPDDSLLNSVTVNDILEAVKGPVIETFTGRLETFESGDVVVLLKNGAPLTVRLYGIDCPEEGQPFYEAAMKYGQETFGGSQVEANVVARDNHDLPVAFILNTDRKSLNHELAAQGLAWWDERNAPKDGLLRRLSAEAVVNERAIFSDPTPLAPWDYRPSQEIEDFFYTLEEVKETAPAARAPRASEKDDEKTLSMKGDMVESTPRSAPVQLQKMDEKIDAGALMMRHAPRIAKNSSGQPIGLTATDISAIPYAAQLGFQNGDVISRVNGIAIESEAQIWSLIPQFQNVKRFQVEVIRNGQAMTIPISIP